MHMCTYEYPYKYVLLPNYSVFGSIKFLMAEFGVLVLNKRVTTLFLVEWREDQWCSCNDLRQLSPYTHMHILSAENSRLFLMSEFGFRMVWYDFCNHLWISLFHESFFFFGYSSQCVRRFLNLQFYLFFISIWTFTDYKFKLSLHVCKYKICRRQ